MSEMFGTLEENEKFIEERIVSLRRQIEDEKAETHHRIQRIEQRSKEQIRDAQRDFVDRVEPMQRELDALLKAVTIKHMISPRPPMIVPAKDVI